MHACECVCVSLRVGVCRWITGQMRVPGANLRRCGARACFLFAPSVVCLLVSPCVRDASAFRGRQTPSCWVVCITDARCAAAAYYHLVRGEDRVVITTSSSANGCVCSALIYTLESSVVWSVSKRRPEHLSGGSDSPIVMLLYASWHLLCRYRPWMTTTWSTWSMRRWCWWWPAHSGTVIHLKMERCVYYTTALVTVAHWS